MRVFNVGNLTGRALLLCAILFSWACGSQDEVAQSDTGGDVRDASTEDIASTLTGEGVEKLGDVWILPVEVKGFENLDLSQKKKVYERYRAALKEDDLFYRSNDIQNMRTRIMLEQILLNDKGVTPSIRKKIRSYTVSFWLNRGAVDVLDGRCLRPRFIPGELAAAAQQALQNGAAMDLPIMTGKNLGATRIEELEALLSAVRPGMFCERIEGKEAADAGTDVRVSLSDLSRDDRSAGAIVGIENAGQAGVYASLEKKAVVLDRLVRNVGGKKSASPRRPSRIPKTVDVLSATGAYGPIPSGRVNIYRRGAWIDSKETGALYMSNLEASFDRFVGATIVEEFSLPAQVLARRKKWRTRSRMAVFALRLVAGSASDGTEKQPDGWLRERLSETHDVMAQMRADLAALYLVASAHVKKTGLVPDEESAHAVYDEYVCGVFEQFASELGVDDAGFVAARAIVGNLIESRAVEVVTEGGDNGRLYPKIVDYKIMQETIEKLLAKVRKIRFAGDRPAAAALLDTASQAYDPKWKKHFSERWKTLKLPNKVAFLYPLLEQVRDGEGAVVDIRLVKSTNFLERQLTLAATRSLD